MISAEIIFNNKYLLLYLVYFIVCFNCSLYQKIMRGFNTIFQIELCTYCFSESFSLVVLCDSKNLAFDIF